MAVRCKPPRPSRRPRRLIRQGRRSHPAHHPERLPHSHTQGYEVRQDKIYANDLEDNIKADLFRLEEQTLVINKTSHLPSVGVLEFHNSLLPLRWLSENSYAYSLLMNTVWNTAKSILLSTKRAELTTELAIPTRTVGDYEKQLTVELIDRRDRLCEAHSVAFVIPDIPQTDEGLRN